MKKKYSERSKVDILNKNVIASLNSWFMEFKHIGSEISVINEIDDCYNVTQIDPMILFVKVLL